MVLANSDTWDLEIPSRPSCFTSLSVDPTGRHPGEVAVLDHLDQRLLHTAARLGSQDDGK
jgi:hypothetical protein